MALDSAPVRLVILFGGRSAEHEVSCVTAAHVVAAVDRYRYDVVPVGIAEDGQWVMADAPEGATTLVAEGPGVDPSVLTPESLAFPLVHGPMGEDGTIQGLLEVLHIPYTHCGVLASALAMHMPRVKDIVKAAGVPILEGRVMHRLEAGKSHPLPPPYVVKPVSEGFSV